MVGSAALGSPGAGWMFASNSSASRSTPQSGSTPQPDSGGSGWGFAGMGPWMMGGGPWAGHQGGAWGEAAPSAAPVPNAGAIPSGVPFASAVPLPSAAPAPTSSAAEPSGATVDPATNTLTFRSASVALTVLAAPPGGPDQTFQVAGMTDPTIVVPQGAQVTLHFINADQGMPHDWLLSTASPPFPYMAAMYGPATAGAFAPILGEATSSSSPSETVRFIAAEAGRFTYLCTVPGHAQEGMFGTFVVKAG